MYKEMSHLDYLFILHIKELREKRGWVQQELSKEMGVASSFVGNVESCVQRHKYSIRHLPLLAYAFNVSVSELFEFPLPKFDKVRLTIEITKIISGDTTNTTAKVVDVKGLSTVVKSNPDKN